MSHYTQKGFKNQLDKMRQLIIKFGGIAKIEDDIGINHFVYYCSEHMACLPKKAREYYDIVKMSAIAQKRMENIANG